MLKTAVSELVQQFYQCYWNWHCSQWAQRLRWSTL